MAQGDVRQTCFSYLSVAHILDRKLKTCSYPIIAEIAVYNLVI